MVEKHFPENLLYTKEHEWCRVDGDVATVGITWHAQDALGDIVYCELPGPGEEIRQGDSFGVVESVKAVSDLYAPVSGTVTERNDAIVESPEGINADSYDDGWMVRVRIKNKSELSGLMSAEQYVAFLKESEE